MQDYVLVDDSSGTLIHIGEVVRTIRGYGVTILGFTPPVADGSGKVILDGPLLEGSYYPSVIGARIQQVAR